MIKVSYKKLKSNMLLEALRLLAGAKLPFKVSYHVMRVTSLLETELKAVDLFLSNQMKKNAELFGKKQEELSEEQKAQLETIDAEVNSFMEGEAVVDKEPVYASQLSELNIPANTLFTLIDSGIVKDDIDVKPEPQGEPDGKAS